MTDPRIFGRLYLRMDIELQSGMHIGSTSGDTDLSALNNPMLRHPLTKLPYIPGSSLRGKMRSLMEYAYALPQNEFIRSESPVVRIHSITDDSATRDRIDADAVCALFGVNGDRNPAVPTRLTVTDFHLSGDAQTRMQTARVASYSEVKTEVSIDRRTTAANPRQNERTPAGAVFTGGEMIYTLYASDDLAQGERLLELLMMLQDHWVGGSGSRGYGNVNFASLVWAARRRGGTQPDVLDSGADLHDLLVRWSQTYELLRGYFGSARS